MEKLTDFPKAWSLWLGYVSVTVGMRLGSSEGVCITRVRVRGRYQSRYALNASSECGLSSSTMLAGSIAPAQLVTHCCRHGAHAVLAACPVRVNLSRSNNNSLTS